MSHDAPAGSSGRTPKCPVCRKPPVDAYRPFCSKRCADVDLGRWVTGSYVIPGGDSDSDDDGLENVPGTKENVQGDE